MTTTLDTLRAKAEAAKIPVYSAGTSRGAYAYRSANVVAYAIVDDDMAHLAQIRWYQQKNSRGYLRGTIGGRLVYMHRLIAKSRRGQEVSHLNGNPLDNRRCNLAHASHSENKLNRNDGPWRHNRHSGIRGVTRVLRAGGRVMWVGAVQIHGKRFCTSPLATPELALAALLRLRRRLGLRNDGRFCSEPNPVSEFRDAVKEAVK